jgi:hypothetical protein
MVFAQSIIVVRNIEHWGYSGVTYESWPMSVKFQLANGACSLVCNGTSIILVMRVIKIELL